MAEALEDYWAVLGLVKGASKQDVQRAYRKKSLAVHPDRYSGSDPEWATEEFLKLTRAKEVLEDDKARAAFEALQAAREKHAEKRAAQDAGRKKMREDLEAREEAAKKRARPGPSAAESMAAQAQQDAAAEKAARAELQRELERLRRSGRLGGVGKGVDSSHKDAASPASAGASVAAAKVTLRWTADKSFEAEGLKRLLVELGAPADGLVLAMGGAKAMVELPSAADAQALAERSEELTARGIRMSVQLPTGSDDVASAAAPPVKVGGGVPAGDGSLPLGWKEQTASGGRPYYYQVGTRVSQWMRPNGPASGETAAVAAAPVEMGPAEFERLEAQTLARLHKAAERQQQQRRQQQETHQQEGQQAEDPTGAASSGAAG